MRRICTFVPAVPYPAPRPLSVTGNALWSLTPQPPGTDDHGQVVPSAHDAQGHRLSGSAAETASGVDDVSVAHQ
jgi:hypothetical protein